MAKKEETEEGKELTESQKVFCNEWIFDFNGSRAYKSAYPGVTDESARALASNLLTNLNIKAYCKHLQDNLAETSGISRLRILREHEKMAFSSIAHLHNTWLTRKAFEELTEDQKSCIESIETSIKTINETPFEIEYVKIKLYSKQKSLDSMAKMLGFEPSTKLSLSLEETVKSFKIVPASDRKGNSSQR